MANVAVVLSGCGVYDGAEINEAVLTLLSLEQQGATYQCFAPDLPQMHVINHLTGEPAEGESRNVLVEAARIARGNIKPLADASAAILGLTLDAGRPDLGYPGAWLQAGNQQIHLLELPNPDPLEGRPEHGGRDRHVALLVSNLGVIIDNLTRAGVPYGVSRSGRKALFCRDPDGNALEFIQKDQPPSHEDAG